MNFKGFILLKQLCIQVQSFKAYMTIRQHENVLANLKNLAFGNFGPKVAEYFFKKFESITFSGLPRKK